MQIHQVFIGVTTEGTTDERFLESILTRTFEEIAFECVGTIEPIVRFLKVDKINLHFTDYVLKASRQGVDEMGMMVLCIHCDADDASADSVMKNKFIPAQESLSGCDFDKYCKILIPVIPIQMIEAWMLADLELLESEIGVTNKSDLPTIARDVETIAKPKDLIKEIIRVSQRSNTKRRRRDLKIDDLYQIIGQKLDLEKLKKLSSFVALQNYVRIAFKQLNLMR